MHHLCDGDTNLEPERCTIEFQNIPHARGWRLQFSGTLCFSTRQSSFRRPVGLRSFMKSRRQVERYRCRSYSNLARRYSNLARRYDSRATALRRSGLCVHWLWKDCAINGNVRTERENRCPNREDRQCNSKCVKFRYHIWFNYMRKWRERRCKTTIDTLSQSKPIFSQPSMMQACLQ